MQEQLLHIPQKKRERKRTFRNLKLFSYHYFLRKGICSLTSLPRAQLLSISWLVRKGGPRFISILLPTIISILNFETYLGGLNASLFGKPGLNKHNLE